MVKTVIETLEDSMKSPRLALLETYFVMQVSLQSNGVGRHLKDPAPSFACFLFQTRSHCVAQAGLKVMILLLQSPKYCDWRCVGPHSP